MEGPSTPPPPFHFVKWTTKGRAAYSQTLHLDFTMYLLEHEQHT